MKLKKYFVFLVFVLSLFLVPKNIKADYNAVVIDDSYLCDIPAIWTPTGRCVYTDSTLSAYNPGLYWLDKSDAVYVYENDKFDSPNKDNCSDYFVKISYSFTSNPNNKLYGYFCHAALMNTDTVEDNEYAEYIEEFKKAGFPESYYESLLLLKINHPNWTFIAANTGLDFYEAVRNEGTGARSVIRTSTARNNNWAIAKTGTGAFDYINDKYIAYDDISGNDPWIQANNDTIAYYMDPRNFLSDMYIFQFESLLYDANGVDEAKMREAISKLLQDDYLANYVDIFIAAGAESKVSPVYLASLSKQEIGGYTEPTTAIRGDYNGMYNFYNIGASDGDNPVFRGLDYASYTDPLTLRPWNTPELAIRGGALWIYYNYLANGQSTSYFKRFNVIHDYLINNNLVDDPYPNYYHQYMTNLFAPKDEALSSFRTYKANNSIDNNYIFLIPVYNNIPEKTELPTNGGWPNNYMQKIVINDKEIVDFNPAAEDYIYHLDINNPTLKIEGVAISNKAKVVGNGTYTIDKDQTVNIAVVAENGESKTYNIQVKLTGELKPPTPDPETITVKELLNQTDIKNNDTYLSGFTVGSDISIISKKIKNVNNDAIVRTYNSKGEEKTSGLIATGDKVKIMTKTETKEYEVVIFGDVNGDGEIYASDYVKIKNHIMDISKLEGVYAKAADVNGDGQIYASDYVKIKNHIMDIEKITQ